MYLMLMCGQISSNTVRPSRPELENSRKLQKFTFSVTITEDNGYGEGQAGIYCNLYSCTNPMITDDVY